MNLEILFLCLFAVEKNLENSAIDVNSCYASITIYRYVTPFILLLGIVGNTLSLIVLCRRSLIKASSYIYLASITFLDFLMTIFGLTSYIEFLYEDQLIALNWFVCAMYRYFKFSASYLSVWLIVAMTIDRLIAVCSPLKAWSFSKPKRCKRIIFTMSAIVLISNIFWFFISDVKIVNLIKEKKACTNPRMQSFIITDGFFYSYFPSTIIMISNGIIIYNIYQSNFQRKKMANIRPSNDFIERKMNCNCFISTRNNSENGYVISERPSFFSASIREKKQLTILLLTVSFLFLFLTFPITLMKILGDKKLKSRPFFDTMGQILSLLNHTINFIIYCSMGNKFRKQLFLIFKRSKKRKNNAKNQNQPIYKDSSIRNEGDERFGEKVDKFTKRIFFKSHNVSNDSDEIKTPVMFPSTK